MRVVEFASVALLDSAVYKVGVGVVGGSEIFFDGDESWRDGHDRLLFG